MNSTPVIIYNPAAGRGLASRRMEQLRSRLPSGAKLLQSHGPGEGEPIAMQAIADGSRWLLAAGGDGTVHEVANGILRSGQSDVVFTPLPFGSMNDYAYTLGLLAWWDAARPWSTLNTMTVDVGVIRGGGRERYFVNCCGVGFNGMVTREARRIRNLRGLPLYALAVIKAMMKHFDKPLLTIETDTVIQAPTLAYSIAIGQREGGFPLLADARLDDGLFDTLHVGAIRRAELIRHLPGMITGQLPRKHPQLRFGQANRITIRGKHPLCVHIDGEFFCTPEDEITVLNLELLPQRLLVSCDQQSLYGKASAGDS